MAAMAAQWNDPLGSAVELNVLGAPLIFPGVLAPNFYPSHIDVDALPPLDDTPDRLCTRIILLGAYRFKGVIALGAACAVGAAVLPLGPRAPLFSLLTAADVHRLTLANLIMANCYYALAEGVEVPLSQAREAVVSLIESMGDPEQEKSAGNADRERMAAGSPAAARR